MRSVTGRQAGHRKFVAFDLRRNLRSLATAEKADRFWPGDKGPSTLFVFF